MLKIFDSKIVIVMWRWFANKATEKWATTNDKKKKYHFAKLYIDIKTYKLIKLVVRSSWQFSFPANIYSWQFGNNNNNNSANMQSRYTHRITEMLCADFHISLSLSISSDFFFWNSRLFCFLVVFHSWKHRHRWRCCYWKFECVILLVLSLYVQISCHFYLFNPEYFAL